MQFAPFGDSKIYSLLFVVIYLSVIIEIEIVFHIYTQTSNSMSIYYAIPVRNPEKHVGLRFKIKKFQKCMLSFFFSLRETEIEE